MKRPMTSNEAVDVITLDESASSDSDMEDISKSGVKQSPDDTAVDNSYDDITPEDALLRRAEMYQEYMKQIPIPHHRGSVIPFTTWTGLGKSMKQLYNQPLHYLTNRLLKQWDQSRIGSEDEYTPLDIMMHPSKAEATVWLVEEIHRRTSSHYHIAKFWLSDPMYHYCVDSIFPQLGSSS